MQYECLGKYSRFFTTYHIRVYKENVRLRFEALDVPFFPMADRTCIFGKGKKHPRKFLFYLDDV